MIENIIRRPPNHRGACPIGCLYCVITQVNNRAFWRTEPFRPIGLNKAVTILNPPLHREDTKDLDAFYEFPLRLLEADRVGFNAITDPFWPKYRKELEWFVDNVAPIAKAITCVTKFPVPEKDIEWLASIPNFQLNVSITGLGNVECSTTESRLQTLKLAKKHGLKAFPTIHPYISGLSNLSFLKDLRTLGYEYVDVKGLRYDHAMDVWMPQHVRDTYRGTEGSEHLPDDGWKNIVDQSGLTLKSLRVWGMEQASQEPSLTESEARSRVRELLSYAHITSSDTDQAVIEATIQRRL